MGSIGAWEIALIVVVVLLLFGSKRLPQMARATGRGIREFKESVFDQTKELREATFETPRELKRALNPFAGPSDTDAPSATAAASEEAESPSGTERPVSS